jgi:hypothetical protein
MALQALKFIIDIAFQGIGYIHMMTGHANLHNFLLILDEVTHHPA